MRQVPSFKQFQFQPFINEALAEKGFEEPTEVQEKLIPIIQKGKSVIGQSQTGSGKTHTFLLPLMDKVKPTIDEVQIVITAPSRELANQIYQEAQQLARFSQPEIRVSNFVGGTDKQRQLNKLKHQQPHVVIGTPGRILDMMNEQALKVLFSRSRSNCWSFARKITNARFFRNHSRKITTIFKKIFRKSSD